jgi:hypothetical protein
VVAQQADGRSQSSGVHSRHMQPFLSRRPHALACQIWHGHNRPWVARAVFEKGGTTVTDILSAGALLRVGQTRATTDGLSRLCHPAAPIRAAEVGLADLRFFSSGGLIVGGDEDLPRWWHVGKLLEPFPLFRRAADHFRRFGVFGSLDEDWRRSHSSIRSQGSSKESGRS